MNREVLALILSSAVTASCSGVQNPKIEECAKPISSLPASEKTQESAFYSILATGWAGFADMKYNPSNNREERVVNVTLEKELSVRRTPCIQITTDNKELIQIVGAIDNKQRSFVIKVDLPENKHPKTPLEKFAESISMKEGITKLPMGTVLSFQFRHFQLPTAQGLPPEDFPAYELRIPPIPPKKTP